MEIFTRLLNTYRFLKFGFLGKLLVIGAFVLSIISHSSALGQTVSVWSNPITGNNPGLANPYTTGDAKSAYVTVSGIGAVGIANQVAVDRYNFDGWLGNLDAAKYFNFQISPIIGYKLSLSDFFYSGQRETNNGSNAGPLSFAFRSNANSDNYSTDIGTALASGTTINLSGASYQNLSGATQFRYYAWAAGASGDYSINDFTFKGTVLGSATTTLTGFNYPYGSGPSTAQNFAINGVGLTTPGAIVTITGSASYEVSTTSSTSGFGSTATLTASGGTLNGSVVWVRLKSGLSVGSYNETITFGGGGVSGLQIPVSGIVSKVNLTIIANNQTKVYGSANPTLTIAYSGFVGSDSPASLSTPVTITTTATASSSTGNYPISVGGGIASNYNLVYQPGTLSVTPATLTITGAPKAKIYGDVNPPLTVTYTGFVNGDLAASLTTQPATTTTANTTSMVGNYPITVSGASSSNYAINYVAGSLTINPAALIITADNKTKVYGTANPALTVSFSGFKGSDNQSSLTTIPTAVTAASIGSAVGSYPITASGAAASNYSFSYASGIMTVSKAPVSTVLTSDSNPVCQGGTVTLSAAVSANPAGITGSIQFFDGATLLGTSAVLNDAGSIIMSSLTAGSHNLTARYTGDANYNANTSPSIIQVVNARPTGSLSGSSTICKGSAATLSIAVTGSGTISGTLSDGTTFSGIGPTISVQVTPLATTVYSITSLSSGTCTSISSDITGSAVITVNEPISITVQPTPASQVICSGNTVSYSVTATGTGPLTYQWYKGTTALVDDGVKFSGATTSTLSLLLVNAANSTSAGNEYYVKVSGPSACNPVNSSRVNLIVNTEINITSQPLQQNVCEGSNATFTATAEGTGPFTVQWFKGSSQISAGVNTVNNSSTNITTTLTLTGVTVADQAANYYAIIKNESNVCPTEVSNEAALIVNRNSTINLSSPAGTSAQTICINTAITPIAYVIGGGGLSASVVPGSLPAGLTGSYNSGVFTISGTPTATGTFSYTVTTTGPCNNSSLSGTIIINPNSSIASTSAGGTNAQTVCLNNAVTNIVYSVAGATGASITAGSLPSGVTGSYNSGVFTISGIPTVSGSYSYTVTTTGSCVNSSLSGTLLVNANSTIVLSSVTGTDAQTKCINNALTNITYAISGGATGAVVSAGSLPSGVTASYSAGVLTISGTPSGSGTYNYTVTSTGPCVNPSVSGIITVNANSTIALASASATTSQTPCVNTPLNNIVYTIGGGGTGATFAGLPAGITGSFTNGVATISGTPTATGTFNYTVTTSGSCVNLTSGGTINVRPDAAVTLTSQPATTAQSLCINTAITPITYSITGGGASAIFSGLPAGVTGTITGSVATISGTPTVSGSFSFTVTSTGTCVQTLATGNISVSPVTIAGTLAPAITVGCVGTASGKITLSGSTGTILRWELSSNAGNTWTTIANTSNATEYNYVNLSTTTLYRAVIQSGNCGLSYSKVSIIVVDPPYTPVIVATPPITCIGEPVTLTAVGYPSLGTITGGNFDNANPPGWNGASANNNNEDPNSAWGLTNGDKVFNDVKYSSTGKFMIATGVPPTITGQPAGTTYLTTPFFSTVGLTTFSLTWRQAYNLNAGAVAKVEISIDGGLSYITLETYTGPANLNPTQGLTAASINLDAYLGRSNLKFRFNYTGSAKSNWALDDINMSQTYHPLNYTWTGAGLSSTTGSTVIYTPTASGTFNLQVSTTTNSNCPGAGSGSVAVTVNPSPTLGTVTIAPVCMGSDLTVKLTGLLANSTSTLLYQIDGGVVNSIANVVADAAGNASFIVPVSLVNSGLQLEITSISSRRTSGNAVSCSMVPGTNGISPITIVKGYVWTGMGADNLWTTVANWNICGVPPDGSSVTIPDVTPKHFPKLNVDFFTTNNFDLLGNATIDLNGMTFELGTSTSSVLNMPGQFIGSTTSSLTVFGASTTLRFSQTSVGTTNALKNFIMNGVGQTVTLGNPIWVVGNVFPTAGVIVSAGNLTMVSTATTSSNITAFALPNDVSGVVNVQAYITGGGPGLVNRGFRSMSSPINDAFLDVGNKTFKQMKSYIPITGPGGVGNGFDQGGAAQPFAETITLYNEKAPAFAPSAPSIATIDQEQVPGTGFLAFFRGSQGGSYANNFTKLNAPFVTPDQVTITYSGPINKFSLPPIALDYTNNPNDSYNGYNLVGNPYPSSIDWNNVIRSANVINTFIIVLPGGKQASYLNGVDNNISTTIIQPTQGFYVRANSAGGTLTFTESSKSILYPNRLLTIPQNVIMSTTPLAFSGSDQVSSAERIIRLKIQDDTNTDETTLVFGDQGSMLAGFEDALYFSAGPVSLASFSSDEKRLAINGLPDLSEVQAVRLNVNASSSRAVKLNFFDLSQAKGYEVFLKDTLSPGKLVDVKANPIYDFSIDKSKLETYGNERFTIVFKKEEIFPLALNPFVAKKQNDAVELTWSIVTTGIAKEFEIEQSVDGITFHKIGSVKSQGNTRGTETYYFTDKDPVQGMNYYRIRQIHLNGRASLSEIRKVDNLLLNGSGQMTVFPNPAINEVEIKLTDRPEDYLDLTIFDMHGRKILQKTFSSDEQLRCNIANVKAAIYVLEIRASKSNKMVGREKFIKGL